MALFRVFRLPEHSRFNYKPVYYDEQKEKLDAKRAQYQKEKAADEKIAAEYKPQIKGAFKGNYQKSLSSIHKTTNLRILVILAFLGSIAYLIIQNSNLLDYMFKALVK